MKRKERMQGFAAVLFACVLLCVCAFFVACTSKDGGNTTPDGGEPNPPAVSMSIVGADSGSGTESDPYVLALGFNGSKQLTVKVVNSEKKPIVSVAENGAATAKIDGSTLTVSAVAQGSASVVITLSETDIKLYLSVTVFDDSAAVTGTVRKYGDDGALFEGVTVKLVSSDYTAYSVTDGDGAYWFTHLDVDCDYTVTVQLDGDYADYVSDVPTKTVFGTEFDSADARLVRRDFSIIKATEAPKTDIRGTVTSGGTAVGGITVTANSKYSAATGADGKYSIEGVYAFGDITVTANDGNGVYALFTRTLDYGEVVPGGVTECDAELGLPYADYGVVCNNDSCAGYYFKYTRSAAGFEFSMKPQGGTLLGNIELFIDTKNSGYDRDATDYLISTDGRIAIVSSYGVTPTATELISVRKTADELLNETVYISVPYAFFAAQGKDKAVAADEVLGVSLGYKVKPVWVGFVDKLSGGGRLFDNSLYIAPEHPVAYMRLNAKNKNYRADGNIDVDFDGYKGSFGFGNDRADAFHVNVAKSESGIALDFITTGNFGGKNETDEFIALYLDLDVVKQGGWNYGDTDLVVRLYGDGTVRYKGGSPWWKRDAAGVTAIENAFTVDYENGVTTIGYTLPWNTVGITADDEFGFAFREACDSDADMTLYGSLDEFVYDGHRVADTAAQDGFVRSTKLGG